MLKKEIIQVNEENKSAFLKYISYLIKKPDPVKSNKNKIKINNDRKFLEKVQKFPLEPDKFIMTNTDEKIKDNNNILESICFCKKGFFQELTSLVDDVINDSRLNSDKEKIKLTQEVDIENDITSFIIKTTHTEKTILELSFKNTNKEKLEEIKEWLDEIAKYANQIIDLKNKSSNIEKNSYDKIKEYIEKINSPNKISDLFYIIEKQIKEKNIKANDNSEIEGLYNTYREIEDSIEFLKKLNNDSSVLQNQKYQKIFKKVHNYINSLSDKDLLINVLGNIVEKASSILDVMKKNAEYIKLGQLIKTKDLDLNKLKTIMNSSKEYFFNKEKAQKPEEIIDNNESTSKKRMIDEDNCYEHNNKKAKKSDICHIKDKKISHKIKQPIEYSEKKSTKEVNNKTNELHSSEKSTKEVNNETNELNSSEKSTKEVNNKTNELHSSGFQFTCYIYPKFKGIKSVKIPNQ